MSLEVRNNNLNNRTNRTILAGDVGATKTLLALFNYYNNKLSLLREEKFITKDCSSFESTIKNFLGNDEVTDVISLGVAGPVTDSKVKITNISLALDSKQLSAALNNVPVHFINDLEATAYGLSQLSLEDF
jgi:glucokinase